MYNSPVKLRESTSISVPQGWQLVKLLDQVSLPNGQLNPRQEPYCNWILIAPDHIESETGKPLKLQTAAEQNAISGKYRFQSGDVLYSKIRPYLRKAVLANEEGLCSADMYPLRPGTTIVPRFLLAVILGEDFSRFATAVSMRSGFPKINREELGEYYLALPPYKEQEHIAQIIDTIDSTITHTSTLIAKLKQMKAGLLHDLLTRGLDENGELRNAIDRPEQFKDSPLGQIPKDWSVYTLEDCVHSQITYGIVQAGSHIENGVPYIRTGDMARENLTLDGLLRTSRQIAAMYQRSTVRTGEIVCAIRATVGKVLEVPPELDGANLTQGTARIAPRQEINNHFLLWFLRSNAVKKQIDLVVKGTTFAEITLEALRKIKVAIPSKREEQDRIAAILEAHEKQVNAEEAYLSKLKEQKKGLMHDLLTGRVRVTDLKEIPA